MAGEDIWLKKRENYQLICYLIKYTVSTINLTFLHQTGTVKLQNLFAGVLANLHSSNFSLRRYSGRI